MNGSTNRSAGVHEPDSGVDPWVELQQVERDICLLYHQLSDYDYLMSDLDFGRVFSRRYWDYLDIELEEIPSDQRSFIQQGCLVMILAMATDLIEDSGNHLESYLAEVSAAVDACIPLDERTGKLRTVVELALTKVVADQGEMDDLLALSSWAHREFVGGYFTERARSFGTGA